MISRRLCWTFLLLAFARDRLGAAGNQAHAPGPVTVSALNKTNSSSSAGHMPSSQSASPGADATDGDATVTTQTTVFAPLLLQPPLAPVPMRPAILPPLPLLPAVASPLPTFQKHAAPRRPMQKIRWEDAASASKQRLERYICDNRVDPDSMLRYLEDVIEMVEHDLFLCSRGSRAGIVHMDPKPKRRAMPRPLEVLGGDFMTSLRTAEFIFLAMALSSSMLKGSSSNCAYDYDRGKALIDLVTRELNNMLFCCRNHIVVHDPLQPKVKLPVHNIPMPQLYSCGRMEAMVGTPSQASSAALVPSLAPAPIPEAAPSFMLQQLAPAVATGWPYWAGYGGRNGDYGRLIRYSPYYYRGESYLSRSPPNGYAASDGNAMAGNVLYAQAPAPAQLQYACADSTEASAASYSGSGAMQMPMLMPASNTQPLSSTLERFGLIADRDASSWATLMPAMRGSNLDLIAKRSGATQTFPSNPSSPNGGYSLSDGKGSSHQVGDGSAVYDDSYYDISSTPDRSSGPDSTEASLSYHVIMKCPPCDSSSGGCPSCSPSLVGGSVPILAEPSENVQSRIASFLQGTPPHT